MQAANGQSDHSYLLTDSSQAVAINQGSSGRSATAAQAQSPDTELLMTWGSTGCQGSISLLTNTASLFDRRTLGGAPVGYEG